MSTPRIEKGAEAAAIIHAVVSLGRGLRMKVVAEGIDTAEPHLFLHATLVHTMRGNRFGKICPAGDIEAAQKTAVSSPPPSDIPTIAFAG